MIIGKGLLATAFSKYQHDLDKVCVYAAGVSNSANIDDSQFERERKLITQTFEQIDSKKTFLYFSTCSVYDPSMTSSQYVLHKLRMEALVKTRENYLILRLPQVVGNTLNPNTLFNYLSSKILRGEHFTSWTTATRNLIDVEDVAAIVFELVVNQQLKDRIINIANAKSVKVKEIINIIEGMLGKKAVFTEEARGSDYQIDISDIQPVLTKLNLQFDNDYYIKNLIQKYYMYKSLNINIRT